MENEKIVVAEETSTEFSEISQDKVDETIIEKNEENIEDVTSEIVEESPVSEEVEVAEEAPVVEEEVPVIEETVEVAETEFASVEPETTVADDVIDEEAPAEYAGCKKEDDKKKTQCAKAEDEEEKKEDEKSDESKEDSAEDKKEEEDDEEKKKYALLEEKYTALEAKYSALEAEYQKLSAFKKDADDKAKDELISSFSMLTQAEMKDVIDNKAQFSLEDIESKLSVIYSRKQRAQKEKTDEVETEAPVIYTVQDDCSSNPDWVNEVLNYQKTM